MRFRHLAAAGLAAVVLAIAPAARAQENPAPLPVVASMSILADITRNVGGERVAVTSLVDADGDAHVYSPTPADAKRVAAAKLIVVNGLGLEGWLQRLVKASGTKARQVVATKGISPLKEEEGHGHGKDHDHADADPHAWQAVANVKIYVENIRDALATVDPVGKDNYKANADAYLGKLDALDVEIRLALGRIPDARRRVITTHDAFGYFEKAYGLAFIAPQGVSTESEITAKDVAGIVRQVRAQKIPAVFLENISDPRLMEQIARESGAKVGGTLYSDALSKAGGPASTYIDMMRHNLHQFVAALNS